LGGDLLVNRLGFGAMRLTGEGIWGWPPDRENAKKVLRRAVELGVNFIDTADAYGPETNELLIAEALYPYPKGLVIATKGGNTRPGPGQWVPDGRPEYLAQCVDKSLKRLKLERIDLWQLHDLGLPEDVTAAFGKGGAMEALLEMQDQKVVRFLGVTGHYRPEALIDAINRHPFDAILMALNAADTHLHSFSDQLLPLAVEKQMGIIGMKVPSRGRLLASWTPPPLEKQQHSWEGSAIATRPGVMKMRDAMHQPVGHQEVQRAIDRGHAADAKHATQAVLAQRLPNQAVDLRVLHLPPPSGRVIQPSPGIRAIGCPLALPVPLVPPQRGSAPPSCCLGSVRRLSCAVPAYYRADQALGLSW
jgi:aryl-alcohol dehydrogenase-like predicted oxidoreductase